MGEEGGGRRVTLAIIITCDTQIDLSSNNGTGPLSLNYTAMSSFCWLYL